MVITNDTMSSSTPEQSIEEWLEVRCVLDALGDLIEKHVYKIDDGELWWVVAYSPLDALIEARRHYDVDYYQELFRDDVEQIDDNEVIRVWCGDDRPDDANFLKRWPKYAQYEYTPWGGWYVKCIAKKWATFHKSGDLIASTLY